MLITRNQDLILQPLCTRSQSPPDYGFTIDTTARCGANGNILVAINGSEGPETRTFNLAPYLQNGQNIIRYVLSNASTIAMTIITAGTTSDTLTLLPEDAVFYAHPATSAGRVRQPVISVNLADVSNATQIAVRYGYDAYTLDSGDVVQSCGTGTCILNMDLAIGQPGAHYYRLIYLGANGSILATSDVQTL